MSNNIYYYLLLLPFLLFIPMNAQAESSDDFITVWRISESLTIPVGNATGTYTINWGDDTTETITGDATYSYSVPGDYTVTISGNFTRIYLNGSDDAIRLLSIDQWGTIQWSSMNNAFAGTNLTINASDTPDLTSVTDMSRMFANSSFNGDLSKWDVSSVTSMHRMFYNSSFNGDLSNWDVSSVTDMSGIFINSSFNGDLGSWDVSSVTSMHRMFANSSFNGDLSNWDVSSVTDMRSMFLLSPFNGDLSNWDVSSVTNMNSMFANSPFNGDLGSWDVSSVTDMRRMFANSSFNGDLGSWYITLDNTILNYTSSPDIGVITAQNGWLAGQIKEYSLVAGTGDADNSLFEIINNILSIKNTPQKSEYNIRIADDYSFFTENHERSFVITRIEIISPTPELPQQKSGGGSSGDRTPPSLTRSFDEGTETIFINGVGIVPGVNKIDHILDESIIVQTGDVVPFSISLYENTGWQNIAYFEICLNIQGNRNISCGSDTAVAWDKNKPDIEIIDPHGFISDASVNVTEIGGGVVTFDFFITFANPMDVSHIQFHFWDTKRNSSSLTVENALTVIDTEPTQELPNTDMETVIDTEPTQELPNTDMETVIDTEPEESNQIDIVDKVIIEDQVIVSEQVNSEDYVISRPTFHISIEESVDLVDSDTEIHIEIESTLEVDDSILEPSCGPGTVLQNGICEVDTSKQNIEPDDENWLSILFSWFKF